ncbi:MAG: hypothetical protein K0S65_5182 [Labilithrix sp.]|nr:hypothetical protein [Labilithrix sp.]
MTFLASAARNRPIPSLSGSLLRDVVVVEERDRRALEGLRSAAVEERACTGEALHHRLRRERPGDAPARVAPVLREAVEDDDGIGVDVLDVTCGTLDGQSAGPTAVDVVRVELVEEERAVEVAGDAHPAFELFSRHELAGRVARVREEKRRETTAQHLTAKVVRGEAVAALAFEQDRDAREGLEDVEQLLVRRVVGDEVAEVDAAEACGSARERGTATAGDADVLGGVLRG